MQRVQPVLDVFFFFCKVTASRFMFFELIVALSVTTTVSQAGMPYMPNLVFKVVVAAVVLFSPFDVLSAIDCVFEYRQPKMNSYCVFARNELRFC